MTSHKEKTTETIWKVRAPEPFNAVSTGKPFRSKEKMLILGHQDGIVRTYSIPKRSGSGCLVSRENMETKGGPIQAQLLHNTTRFGGCDIIVADSKGIVTLFCNGQILKRKQLSNHAIHHMVVEDTVGGRLTILTADCEGNISAFAPYTELWNLRLADIPQLKSGGISPKVKSLLPVTLKNIYGNAITYVLATDDCGQLYFIQNGDIVLILRTPQNITAMCSGRFIDPEEIETDTSIGDGDANTASEIQVALGCESGAIYLMSNFQVYPSEFANTNYPIRHMKTLSSRDNVCKDTILCGGNFNALSVLKDGMVVCHHTLPDWITSIATEDCEADDGHNVIVGCINSELFGLKCSL